MANATPEELDEKLDFERLYGESGWHRLEKQWQAKIDEIKENALASTRNEGHLWYQRGMVEVLETLMRLRPDLQSPQPPEFELGGPDYE